MLVVTGASGLLGASLVCGARTRGYDVAGIYHRHALCFPGATMVKLDLTEQSATREALAKLRPSTIVHCAAATNVDWCEEHPAEAGRINAQASSFLARTACELGAAFLYISTDAVFDGTQGNYSESDHPAPINVYARSKWKGEQEVLQQHPAALVARVNIYGWNAQDKHCLAEWILHQLASGRTVPGFVDIHFTPILANDLVDVLLAMLDQDLAGLYHVVGSERISKYEFAGRLANSFGYDRSLIVPAHSAAGGLRAPRPADVSLNTGKIAAALGRPMPDVDSGLRRFRALREMGYAHMLKSFGSGAHYDNS